MYMPEINEYRQNLQPLIISEADRLFRQKGIKSVTMEEISKNLHISKRTIYELYTNKEEILVEVLRRSISSNRHYLEEFGKKCSNVMDPIIEYFRLQLQTILTTNPNFYYDIEKYPKALQILDELHEEERAASTDFFQKGISEGYFIPDIDFNVFMHLVSVTKDALRTAHLLKRFTLNEITYNYLCVCIRGICTQKGIAMFDEFLSNYKKKVEG